MTKLGRYLHRFAMTMLAAFVAVLLNQVLAQDAAQPATQGTPAAQDDAAGQEGPGVLSEVVVTAYRQSLKVSLDMKRDAVGSVDASVAEDIADFPDLNLAEAIQRIPGVSI